MKSLLFTIILSTFAITSCNEPKEEVKETSSNETSAIDQTPSEEGINIELKDHVCTDACKNAGTCVMVCGEKGHKCDENCKG